MVSLTSWYLSYRIIKGEYDSATCNSESEHNPKMNKACSLLAGLAYFHLCKGWVHHVRRKYDFAIVFIWKLNREQQQKREIH